MLSIADVAKHNSKESFWVIIDGNAYDVTKFVEVHPGGSAIILRYAGQKDATEEYNLFHAPSTISRELPNDKHLGPVERRQPSVADSGTNGQTQNEDGRESQGEIPLRVCQSLDDLRITALTKLPMRARMYFESGAETMDSVKRNRRHRAAISFHPRVLRNVSTVSMRCQVMGSPSSLPIFIAPAAAAKLGHPDGELCLARGAARMAIPQCVCTYSSISNEEIVDCFKTEPLRRGGVPLFRLYVPKIKENAQDLIKRARLLGFQALIITVDSAVIGKGDDDDRLKARNEDQYRHLKTEPIIHQHVAIRGRTRIESIKGCDVEFNKF